MYFQSNFNGRIIIYIFTFGGNGQVHMIIYYLYNTQSLATISFEIILNLRFPTGIFLQSVYWMLHHIKSFPSVKT